MTTEELLYPRYKVIAIWPGMHLEPFGLHQVVTLQPHKEDDAEGFIYVPYKHKPRNFMWQSFFDLFPHLFKKLQWWERRDSEELPEYVKTPEGKIRRLQVDDADLMLDGCKLSWYNLSRYTPATQTEYEQYVNKKEGSNE